MQLKKGFQYEIIPEGEIWMEMLEKRNRMTHTYDEEIFLDSVKQISTLFFPEIKKTVSIFQKSKCNLMFEISDKTFDLRVKTLAEFAEIEKAGVYGSRAVGNFKNRSDIDLVLFGDNVSEDTLLKLKTRLEQKLPIPYYFDVTHYEKILNPGLKKHIDEFGIVFYSWYNHKFPQ